MKQEVLFSPRDFEYQIRTSFGKSELLCSIDPSRFIREVHHMMAEKLADKIFKELSPAIDKALKEISKEKG